MYTISDRFLEAISKSGKRKTVVDLYYGSVLLEDSIPVVEGSISVDRASRSRRSGSITLADASLFPRIFQSTALSPFGVEARVHTGIAFPNKTEELVPLGVFLVYGAGGDVGAGLIPTVQLFDRAQRVYETSTWSAGDSGFNFGGKTISQAIYDLVQYASPGWPGSLWNFSYNPLLADPVISGAQYNGDTDRWSLIEKLALTVGAECYFDVNGDFHVDPSPAIFPATSEVDAVWTAGAMVSAQIQVTREGTYNSVMVLGSAPDGDSVQPYSVVYDSDVRSKTVWNGYFGKKTLRFDAGWLTTVAECQYLAQTLLRMRLGLSETIAFDNIQNPALDVSDIIVVPINGENNLLMVNSLSLPLNTGLMSVTTRANQYGPLTVR